FTSLSEKVLQCCPHKSPSKLAFLSGYWLTNLPPAPVSIALVAHLRIFPSPVGRASPSSNPLRSVLRTGRGDRPQKLWPRGKNGRSNILPSSREQRYAPGCRAGQSLRQPARENALRRIGRP